VHRVAAAVMAVLITACGELQVPELSGPTLVVEVTNRSDRDVAVGYTFATTVISASGEASSRACRREALRFGMVAGQYVITVDGKRVTTGAIGPKLPEDSEFLVIRLRIHENGGVEVNGPDVLPQAPVTNAAIVSCGET
jgi:hypothetical protein